MNRRIALHTLFYLILIALALVYLLPVYLLVLTGFKPISQVDLKTMWALPIGGSPLRQFYRGLQTACPQPAEQPGDGDPGGAPLGPAWVVQRIPAGQVEVPRLEPDLHA